MSIFIFGHKNPDTDSVASAIALSDLKNKLGYDTIPCVLGKINKESQYVLDYFQLDTPKSLDNIKIQIKDLDYHFSKGITEAFSILHTYKLMDENKLETVAVVDESNQLLGIISMKDIAMGLIKGNLWNLNTSLDNLIVDLEGTVLTSHATYFNGRVSVVDDYYKTVKGSLGPEDVVIVGDRYDIIEYAIESNVLLIIITGDKAIPQKYVNMAREQGVTMLSVPYDTYYLTKVINQCNYVTTIMRTQNIIKFNEQEYLDEVKEEMSNTHFRNYPVIDSSNTFLGFINRKHMMNPAKKNAILVDHNEYRQSATGIEEAEILEIIDHHKLGDISTSMPISFRNMPVGSTCTIIYWMFQEYNVPLSFEVAGVLISGILSDTLLFKSPTTTDLDRQAVEALNLILELDVDQFAMDMFKTGTSLEGQSIEEIFYKDFKEFHLEVFKVGISQVFTLDIEDVFNRKDSFIDFIEEVHQNNSYDISLLLITDILKEGSYLLFKSNNQAIVTSAFNIPLRQGAFSQGIISRKKQVIPKLLEAIQRAK